MANFTFTSHKSEVDSKVNDAIDKLLNEWGIVAQDFATANCPVDTGRLRASITYETDVSEGETVVGTNVEYAPVVEANDDVTHKVGKAHFMRDAITENTSTYQNIAEKHLKSI